MMLLSSAGVSADTAHVSEDAVVSLNRRFVRADLTAAYTADERTALVGHT